MFGAFRFLLALAVVFVFGNFTPRIEAAESVTIVIERAPASSGPWTRLDLESVPRDADGNPRVPLDTPTEFYRTRVELSPSIGLGDPIPLAEIPAPTRLRAEALVAKRLALNEEEEEGWPEGSELAPQVMTMHSLAGDGSVKPSFFEFKIIRKKTPPPSTGPIVTDPEEYLPEDNGYILLGVSEDEFPVSEFATEGPTLTETLAKAAKTSRIRVMRYGPGLAYAEDEKGNALASLGSMPFKPDPNFLQLDGLEWSGDDTNGTDVVPPVIPKLKPSFYANYEEFKNDFATNETFQSMRAIRAARAKLEWDVINGKGPSGLTINLRELKRVFEDLPTLPLPEVSLVSETDDLLRISISSTGGIQITGAAIGTGVLRVRSGRTERSLIVKVIPEIRPLASGDIIDSATFYAGSWGEQHKFHQFNRDEWCPKPGCGPVAWAMLFAWFDRQHGVEYAFRGEGSGKAPPMDSANTANRMAVYSAYNDLHEYCDVICGTDQGATWPTDMTEGFKDYTYSARLLKQIGCTWRINACTGTWPEAGALRSRDAIKKGYPSVVGLGYLWHYVVAYGYCYEIMEAAPGYNITSRYLKCNMGWGPGTSPRWYNMLDSFYAADVKIWRGSNG